MGKLVTNVLVPKFIPSYFNDIISIHTCILVLRYGATLVFSFRGGRTKGFRSTSWWKGVPFLGSKEDDGSHWFVDDLIRKVGSGTQTFF